MAVQFNRTNPAIELFRTGVQAADQAHATETNEFRTRAADERALAADAALRQGIGAIYATPTGSQGAGAVSVPPPPPVAAASPAPEAPVATSPAVAAPQGPTFDPVGGAGEFGVDAPIAAGPAPAVARGPSFDPVGGAGEFGSEPPVARAPAAPTTQPAAPASPATSQPGPAMPAGPASATAARATRGDSPMGGVMRTLANAPGTGQAMLQLFTADRQQGAQDAQAARALRAEGMKLFAEASRADDIATMRAVAQHYGLGIPPEALKSREVMATIAVGIKTAKNLGITDDMMAVTFAEAFLQARINGQDDMNAARAGMAAAKGQAGSSFKTKGHFVNAQGEVTFYDDRGRTQGSGQKARPQKWEMVGTGTGTGSRESATIQNRRDMEARIKKAYPGIDEATVQRLIVNPKAQLTPNDIARVRANMQKLKDQLGRPFYKTPQDLEAAVSSAMQGAQRLANSLTTDNNGGSPAPSPSPAPAPAPGPAPAAPGAGPGAKQRKPLSSLITIPESDDDA